MDFDTFDTDFWSEIQDAPGEIFDIDEAKEDEQTWNEFINGNVTVWQLAQTGLVFSWDPWHNTFVEREEAKTVPNYSDN